MTEEGIVLESHEAVAVENPASGGRKTARHDLRGPLKALDAVLGGQIRHALREHVEAL